MAFAFPPPPVFGSPYGADMRRSFGGLGPYPSAGFSAFAPPPAAASAYARPAQASYVPPPLRTLSYVPPAQQPPFMVPGPLRQASYVPSRPPSYVPPVPQPSYNPPVTTRSSYRPPVVKKEEVAPRQPVKFTYFGLHAKGVACALALAHSGLPWEGAHPDDWATMKPTTPWGELPVLDIPGFGMIGHELQILAYIGREGPNFMQMAVNEVLVSDQLISQAEDIYMKLVKLQPTIKSTEPKCSPEELEKFWTEADDTIHNRGYGLNVYLAKLEKFLVEPVIPDVGLDKFTRNGFSVGECKLFATVDILRLMKDDVLTPYPGLSAFYARVKASEKTKAVLETGDKMPAPFKQYFIAAGQSDD